ncbi:MAG: GGDEF domain-containing protein [Nitrospirae bacterium]|nr:GGDEF domain-containing protein [Nitrospirota bacterium]
MFRKGYHIIMLSIFAAVSFWFIDAVVDYLIHYDEPFLSLLIFNRTEVAFRLLVSAAFLLFGLIMSGMFSKQKRTETALLQEINERKQVEERLYALSTRDELTGLYNRRGFFTLVEQQLKMADRGKNDIHIFYADMDNLKEINDTHGHQEGDLAIAEMAAILKETFRESDIIARVGGDEFVAVPVGTTGETVAVIADRINRNIELHNTERARSYRLSLSFGIVDYKPDSPVSIDELLFQGDALMYEQKNRKRLPAGIRQETIYEQE